MTTYLAQANTGADALVTTRAVTKPGGVGDGAVGVFFLVRWHESGSFPAVTPPAGAVLRGTITTTSMQTQCYLHRVAGETSFTYSWTGGRWSALAALWFSGADAALDLSTAPFQSATGSGTAISTLTVSADAGSALAWHVNTIDTSGVSHAPPGGFTETADVSPWAAAYSIASSGGSQSASGATVSPTTSWAAGLVALPAAASGTSGDAALAGTAALSAAGQRGTGGGAALAGAAGLSGAGVRQATTTAGLDPAAALSASGAVSTAGGGAVDAISGLAAAGLVGHAGEGALDAAVTVSASGVRAAPADAALDAASALDAQGQVAHDGDSALAAAVILTADGVIGVPPVVGSAALTVIGGLAAAGTRAVTVGGSLTAAAALTAAGTADADGHAALATVATLGAAGALLVSGDDADITVGSPYSPWQAGPPSAAGWTAQGPHPGDWEVGAPC